MTGRRPDYTLRALHKKRDQKGTIGAGRWRSSINPFPDKANGMKKLIYLASPYSADPEFLFQQVCCASAYIIEQGYLVFSPIAHTHPIALHGKLPAGYAQWREFDERMIAACDELWVCCMGGLEKESKGVAEECAYARQIGKKIRLFRWPL